MKKSPKVKKDGTKIGIPLPGNALITITIEGIIGIIET
jgi:hypothetical protein